MKLSNKYNHKIQMPYSTELQESRPTSLSIDAMPFNDLCLHLGHQRKHQLHVLDHVISSLVAGSCYLLIYLI